MSDISKIKLPNGDIYNLKDNEALHQGDATVGAIQGITKQGGSIVTITDAANNYPLEELKVSFEPYQEGSGDPSQENIRPFSGWDEVNVYRSGKNLFDGRLVNKNVNANGSENDATNRLSTLFEPIKAGTYTLSFDSNFVCALYVFSNDQVGSQIAEESNIYWNVSPLTFNITNGKYYRIKFKHNEGETIIPSDLTDVQLEVGSTATPYEPYTAISYPVTWQSVGTIYGGYVDLVRGVLVAEWSNIDSYDGETLTGIWISDRDVYVQGTTPTTGAQVAYQLATPITYSITSTEIKTFSGINNFWSNIGTISSITYAQDTKSFIQDYSVKDVQINNTSIVNNGIADIPIATGTAYGVAKMASDSMVKAGTDYRSFLTPFRSHKSTFYGLAKAAGDTTQVNSSNAIGIYTTEAKTAIQAMLGVGTMDETITSTAPTINAVANHRYKCGEISLLDFTPCTYGICEVMFTSGSTPTVLTLPNTVKMPEWFEVESNRIYDIIITDGTYGAVTSWAV